MAIKATIRPLHLHRALQSFQTQAPRSFITLPGTAATKLTETRILPYKSSSLYTLIADVDSYAEFVPYCLESTVTKWSAADKHGNKWPSEADLKVGWGGFEETFTSRLFCVPETVVEALGGKAITSIPKSDLAHHESTLNSRSTANSIFESLSTKWTLKPFHYKPPASVPHRDKTIHPPRDQTEVNLSIEFRFSNPIYAALSKAVAPKVADIMIEAFERRARKLLDGPGAESLQQKRSNVVSDLKMGAS